MSLPTQVKDIQANDLRSDGMIAEGEEKKGPEVVVDKVKASSDSVKDAENATSPATPPAVKGDAKSVGQPVKPEDADEAIKAAANATKQAPEPAPKQTHAESLDVLLQAEKSLTEDFKSKAASLFEETVQARVDARVAQLEENYRTQLEEQTNAVTLQLAEKVDAYLSYVVQNWMKENTVAIDRGLRTEIAEGFIEGMKNLFSEHYIAVPEGKEDQLETLSKKVVQLEEQLNKATSDNVALVTESKNLKRAAVLAEAAKGLAATEVAKLNSLVEDVAFETEEEFVKKVSTIKENALRKTPKASTAAVEGTVETLTEEVTPTSFSPAMAAYADAISRTVKAK